MFRRAFYSYMHIQSVMTAWTLGHKFTYCTSNEVMIIIVQVLLCNNSNCMNKQ